MAALDRVVTLRTRVATDDVDEQLDRIYTTTDRVVWARQEGSKQEEDPEETRRPDTMRVYVVRWTAALWAADPADLSVVEGSRVLQVREIHEGEGRRRFLELHCRGA